MNCNDLVKGPVTTAWEVLLTLTTVGKESASCDWRDGPSAEKRIATLAMIAIDQYAQIIGSRWIEVQEPLEGAMPIYQQPGFEFDSKGRFVIAVECL